MILALALAGCGSDGGTVTSDAPVASSSFCAGTAVAGTCAQAYFATVADCFGTPPTGTCQSQEYENDGGAGGGKAYCWSDGSHLYAHFTLNDAGLANATGQWINGHGTTCMTADVVGGMAGNESLITYHAGGSDLVYDTLTGAVTCPDGSHANIGAGQTLCTLLATFVTEPPGCVTGTCALP
jgi:hypothetical protein